MGALLSLPVTLLNFLLPFTTPGTPFTQDLVHTAILCGTLYYAPQIAEWYNTRQAQQGTDGTAEGEDIQQPGGEIEREGVVDGEEPPLDERLVLQPDDEEEPAQLPPAPTPPPGHQARQQPPAPRFDDFPGPNPHFNDQPGRANPRPEHPRPTAVNRTIGAKKAKSLARKDQRRAYHEFHRQEAELRRLKEAEGAEEREATLAAERERRARREAEIAEKERELRAKRKEEERREAEEEQRRRERVVQRVREEVTGRGAVDLVEEAWKEGKDRMWVEKLVRAGGLLQQLSTDGSRAIITGNGWLVKVDADLMAKAYADAEAFGNANGGRVSFADLGGFMEKAVLARAKA